MTGRVLAGLVLVLYNSWLLWPLVDGGDIMSRGLVSELAADTRPWHNVFRAGDVIVGSLLVGAAVRGGGRWPRRLLVTALGLGVAGDAVFNLTCSVTMDAGCRATGELAGQPWQNQVHAATSTLYTTALLVSLLVVAVSGVGWWRRVAMAMLAVQVTTNVVLAVTDLLGRTQQTWLQVVSIVLSSIWFAVLVQDAFSAADSSAPHRSPSRTR